MVQKSPATGTAVLRLKKLAEPVEPNPLPAEPEPNAAPISAPLPCCISTRPTSTTAVIICTTQTIFSTRYSKISNLIFSGTANCQEFLCNQRCAANQTAINVRHGKQLGRIGGFDATTVKYTQA